MKTKTLTGGFGNRGGVCVLVLFVLAGVSNAAETSAKAAARKILDATGVQGGLIVQLGCGDGKLTAALRANDSYLVHGLDTDAKNIAQARKYIASLGLTGKVSVARLSGPRLPYVDNLVDLVVSEDLGAVSMKEVVRVLCPNGVAYIKTDGKWAKTVKPRPKEIDEWTHYLHDADGNAVAYDTIVGPPRHIQWMAAPTWSRNHHKLASISSVVSAAGRVFYIMDEAPAASMKVPGKWFLVGRDAFNGVLLWRRPMSSWAWHGHGFRAGPAQLPRTLVAKGDRVYAPLGMDEPVSALDAVTGEIIKTYKETKSAEEIILSDGVLLVVTGLPAAEQIKVDPTRRGEFKFPNEKSVVAVRPETGDTMWKWTESPGLVPLTLAATDGRVFFQAGGGVVCLKLDSGKPLWNTAAAEKPKTTAQASAPAGKKKSGRPSKPAKKKKSKSASSTGNATLVVRDGVVLSATGSNLNALSAEDGKPLWDCPARLGLCRSPGDVFVIDGLVWLGPDFDKGRDLHTGEVKKTNNAVQEIWTAGHHHRCYREKATDRYILTAKRGTEFLDLLGNNHTRNNWIRGTCQYGVMPCNGLLYAPSHACGCFMEAKLWGFWAVAPEKSRVESRESRANDRLERGPAFGQVRNPKSETRNGDQWSTHRHDPLRSGSTKTKLPAELDDVWETDLGGRISAPVVAGGNVIVSAIDTHQIIAMNAADGKRRWTFTAGGRVDSPPTVYQGMAIFGCADGYVYCLRLSDGELVWRFRAAPEDLNTVALDQVESVWPVHGNVLIHDGVAYAAAGRSSWLDGGIYLYGLDPATGKVLCHANVRNSHPKPSDGKDKAGEIPRKGFSQNATDYKTFAAPDRSDAFSMAGSTNDILVSDGMSVYLRTLRFDPKLVQQEKKGRHLFSTTGLLDGAEVHRSHWALGTGDFSRTPVAYSWIANRMGGAFGSRLSVPYGLLLSFDDETVWGVRRKSREYSYQLFAENCKSFSADEPALPDFRKPDDPVKFRWLVDLPMRPRAMVRAGGLLLLGGMPMSADPVELAASYEGRKGGLLWTMSTENGSKVAERPLASPPVWDGMAAAGGRLYMTTRDGNVLCLGKGK